jgi:hypothetical protein
MLIFLMEENESDGNNIYREWEKEQKVEKLTKDVISKTQLSGRATSPIAL